VNYITDFSGDYEEDINSSKIAPTQIDMLGVPAAVVVSRAAGAFLC
jgi:hypothetical protein